MFKNAFQMWILWRFLQLNKQMASKIEVLESVQNTPWNFVYQKKDAIKNSTQKEMNSQYYLTLTSPAAPFCFLYFSLVPRETDQNENVQTIIQKLKGNSQEENKQFENCRKSLNAHWNGVSSLPDAIRRYKSSIVKASDDLQLLSSRITFDEGKQLLKAGLAEKKVCVDYHTNNGQYSENILNGQEYVNNYASIIFDEGLHKYLLAFLSHSDKSEPHNVPQTFVDRPIPQKVENIDDKPIPSANIIVDERLSSSANKGQQNPRKGSDSRPTAPRTILNPDERLLDPPPREERPRRASESKILPVEGSYKDSKPTPTVPRQILNPDEKLLVPPPKEQLEKDRQESRRKSSGNLGQSSRKIGEKAREIGRKVEQKVEDAVEDIKTSKTPWLQIAVAGIIIGVAIKIIRG